MRRPTLKTLGFTLVELIIVITIIGILAAVLVPQYVSYVEKSNVSVCNDNCFLIQEKLNSATLLSNGALSATRIESTIGYKVVGPRLEDTGKNVCPKGGLISLEYKDKRYLASCSEHGSAEPD